ncbi:MAG: T9SS type A sorting domain-containing protein [Bacteroidetes bacterium]|nr:T9SS type A sorting domain-containing protein [Bacteroidota bacterium]
MDWTTSSEKNNDRFEVERSFDGKNFEFVTSLKGAGNSKEVRMYNSIDKDVAFKGQVLVYCRIKQVDFDGKYAYSEIKSVSFAPADRLVVTEINPNPFKDYVNVQFTLPANESVEIKVTDIGGATVKTVDLKGTQGVNARRIELPGLAAGAYFIKVKVGDTEHNAKLIKE